MRLFPLLAKFISVGLLVCLLCVRANASKEKEIYLKVITVFTPEEEIRKEVRSYIHDSFPDFVISEIPSSSALWLFVRFKEKQQRSPQNRYRFLISYRISLQVNSYRHWLFVIEGSCQEGLYQRAWKKALRKLVKAFRAKWIRAGSKISYGYGDFFYLAP